MQTYENAATATEGQQFMNLEKKYESFYYGRYAEYAKGTSGKLQGKNTKLCGKVFILGIYRLWRTTL